MPPAAGPPAAAGANGAGAPQQRGGQNLIGMVVRMGIMWYAMQWFRGSQTPAGTPATMSNPLYRKGDLVDMHVYLSEDPFMASRREAELIWRETDIALASSPERLLNYTYRPSEAVKNNGTVHLHVFLSRAGIDLDGPEEGLPPNSIFHKPYNLITYMPRPKNKTGVNLLNTSMPLTTPAKAKKENETVREYISFFKPNATIAVIDHFQAYPRSGIPPQIKDHMVFNDEGNYFPLMYFEEFWLLRDKLVPMNDTVEEVPLVLRIKPLSFWWMQIQQQMEQSFAMQLNTGMTQEGESDEIKRIFLEGNPYLLALTMAVSLLHTVFDFFAFKNDIGFWKDNKSMEGLSARSICINAVCQAIIFLYLLDNETSMVVLFSAGAGCAIEFWKVTKAMDVKFDVAKFPYLTIKDKASYSQNSTKEHDKQASKYLSYVLFPLVIGYAVYTLMYETHRSWYSWILGSLVGAVYTFGFILMCPQLYLNYKLKSVAHLPWRQMTYKFLNTIIDDLFAFVIKMPTLHRLSVFRDDVVFLVYIYQRWIYRVDKTRVNEFGYVAAEGAEAATQPALEGQQEEEEEEEEQQALLEEAAGDAAAGEEPAAAQDGGGGARRRAAARTAAPAVDAGAAAPASTKKSK